MNSANENCFDEKATIALNKMPINSIPLTKK